LSAFLLLWDTISTKIFQMYRIHMSIQFCESHVPVFWVVSKGLQNFKLNDTIGIHHGTKTQTLKIYLHTNM
jgi:hypothetical protein